MQSVHGRLPMLNGRFDRDPNSIIMEYVRNVGVQAPVNKRVARSELDSLTECISRIDDERTRQKYVKAEFLLDTAVHHAGLIGAEQTIENLAQSRMLSIDVAEELTERDGIYSVPLDHREPFVASASMTTHSTTAYLSLIYGGHPDPTAIDYSYTGVMQAIPSVLQEGRMMMRLPCKDKINFSVGTLSEFAIFALSARFANEGIDDWTPAHSTLRQDSGYKVDMQDGNPHWDISIFSRPEPNVEDPQYKIQVKTNRLQNGRKYRQDITVIGMEDIALTDENISSSIAIIALSELYVEYSKGIYSKNVTERIERMLDVIG